MATNIPVIERQYPFGNTIRYRGRVYSVSAPKFGNEYHGYPNFNTAMMYARNWRRDGLSISIVVKALSGEKVIGYFVYVASRKWVMRLK